MFTTTSLGQQTQQTNKQIKTIQQKAQAVLNARAKFTNNTLAHLYDPLTMPTVLIKAHNELDKAVDLAYKPKAFTTQAGRIEFLFDLHEKYAANLLTKEKRKTPSKTKPTLKSI